MPKMSYPYPANLGHTFIIGKVLLFKYTYLEYSGNAKQLLPGYKPICVVQLTKDEGDLKAVKLWKTAFGSNLHSYPAELLTRLFENKDLHLGQRIILFKS